MGLHPLSLLITFTLALSVLGKELSRNSYCTQEAPVDGEPTRPVLPSYVTKIAVKHIHLKEQQIIIENYDADLKKVSIDYSSTQRVFYDLTKDFAWSAYDMYCQTYGTNKFTDSNANKTAVDLILRLGSTWKYKGEKVIKGVSTQWWRSCNSISKWRTLFNFTADYYFTKKDKVPFRLEITGVGGVVNNNGKQHSIYDYFMFTKKKPSPNSMKPPPGIVCKDDEVQTPPMPKRASYGQEMMDAKTKKISNTFVTFDSSESISGEWDEDSQKRILRDFNRAVQFEVDYSNGLCKTKTILDVQGSIDFKGKDGTIHMSSMKQYFLSDGNFTHNGQFKIRGILCDSYTKIGKSAEGFGMSIVEIYTAVKSVKLVTGNGALASQPTVRVVIKGKKGNVKRKIDIYDFDPAPKYQWQIFNIDSCYDPNRQLTFEITFKGPDFNTFEDRLNFQTGAQLQLSKALKISNLRIPLLFAIHDNGSILVRGKLFDKLPPLSRFQLRQYQSPENTKDSYVHSNSSNTPSLCADYCAKAVTPPFSQARKGMFCYGFTFSRVNQDCTFFFHYSREMQQKKYWSGFYQRTHTTQYDGPSLQPAYETLSEKIEEGKIKYTSDNGQAYTAISVKKVNRYQEKNIRKLGTPLEHFTIYTEYTLTSSPIEEVTGYNADGCANRCVNTIKYDCESFVYDVVQKKCSFFVDIKTRYDPKKNTKPLYFRNLLDRFQAQPGLSTLSNSGTLYSKVQSPNNCARLCLNNKAFVCESFELCGYTCVLGSTHFYDTPKTDMKRDRTCLHFSRSYYDDYTRVQHKKALKNSNVVVIKDIGVMKCAQTCSTSPSYECDVFEYCPSTSLCRVTKKHVLNTGDLSYQSTGDCDLYTRTQGRQRLVNYQSDAPTTGHTSGEMGGMAVGMILLSVILTIVIALAVFKFRSGTGFPGLDKLRNNSRLPDLGISRFSKKKLEEEMD